MQYIWIYIWLKVLLLNMKFWTLWRGFIWLSYQNMKNVSRGHSMRAHYHAILSDHVSGRPKMFGLSIVQPWNARFVGSIEGFSYCKPCEPVWRHPALYSARVRYCRCSLGDYGFSGAFFVLTWLIKRPYALIWEQSAHNCLSRRDFRCILFRSGFASA